MMRVTGSLILLGVGLFLPIAGAAGLAASAQERVVLGVYFKVGDDFIEQDQELVFDVGVPCYT